MGTPVDSGLSSSDEKAVLKLSVSASGERIYGRAGRGRGCRRGGLDGERAERSGLGGAGPALVRADFSGVVAAGTPL